MGTCLAVKGRMAMESTYRREWVAVVQKKQGLTSAQSPRLQPKRLSPGGRKTPQGGQVQSPRMDANWGGQI